MSDYLKRIRNNQKSIVYFVQGGDKIKIGVTKDVLGRIASLQVGSPVILRVLATIPDDDGYTEGRLHDKFSHLHSHGEWFHASEELLGFIQTIKSEGLEEVSLSDENLTIEQFQAHHKLFDDEEEIISFDVWVIMLQCK